MSNLFSKRFEFLKREQPDNILSDTSDILKFFSIRAPKVFYEIARTLLVQNSFNSKVRAKYKSSSGFSYRKYPNFIIFLANLESRLQTATNDLIPNPTYGPPKLRCMITDLI